MRYLDPERYFGDWQCIIIGAMIWIRRVLPGPGMSMATTGSLLQVCLLDLHSTGTISQPQQQTGGSTGSCIALSIRAVGGLSTSTLA